MTTPAMTPTPVVAPGTTMYRPGYGVGVTPVAGVPGYGAVPAGYGVAPMAGYGAATPMMPGTTAMRPMVPGAQPMMPGAMGYGTMQPGQPRPF
jgi:hypothetical protein